MMWQVVAALTALFAVQQPMGETSAQKRSTTDLSNAWRADFNVGELRDIRTFARCAARGSPANVAGALDFSVGSAGADLAFEDLVSARSVCVPQRADFTYSNSLLAGSLAENLLAGSKGRMSGLAEKLAVADQRRVVARDDMELAGICVVRAAPSGVVALLSSTPGGQAEQSAIGMVAPQLRGCVPAGQQVRLTKPGLRALLAVSAYRIANATAGN